MKLTSVEIDPMNSVADAAVLSFRDPRAINPFNVKGIVGLDADSIVPRFYKGSGGAKLYTLMLQQRVIVIKIGLNPDYSSNETYSDLRDRLYKMIAASRTGKVIIKFKNVDEVVAEVMGSIAKYESPHFEQTQEVQLTINCDEPMLRSPTHEVINVSTFDPNDTLINDDKSTAPHGFAFIMTILWGIPYTTISDPVDPSWSFSVAPIGGFLPGDVFHFSSEYNNKYLYLVRNDVTVQLADTVTPGSVWPVLFPGYNRFSFANAVNGTTRNMAWDSFMFYPTYWGV